MLTKQAVYDQAIQRYYEDVNRLGLHPASPVSGDRSVVDFDRRVVLFRGEEGFLAAYRFREAPDGRLLLRPLWNY